MGEPVGEGKLATQAKWTELDRRRRAREIVDLALATVVTWVLLFGLYYLIPFTDRTSQESVFRLGAGIGVFVLVLAWQLHRVKNADMPGLRAIQALLATIPLFLITFAAVYLSLSESSDTHFSEPLNHTGALYLVITVFSTVGFGDITPEGDLARILVSVQMILDLVVLGAVVRLILNAAKTGIEDCIPDHAHCVTTPATALARCWGAMIAYGVTVQENR